ncbi:MAG TPA: 2-isopropylmalate synthase [Acidimicrobiia bacterium]|jgi:2-isopropylmalate synthase|nr:2-isopropylmalate synthase [Acidimicrobiia bacterium]
MSDRLIIFDTTLRDGEQAPGIALSPDDKVAIATQLARLRVDVIEAGFAASSPGDFESVSRIAAEVEGPVIASLARTHPDDIDQAADALKAAERKRIHVFISTSPIHMEQMLRMTPQEVFAAAVEGVQRARRYTDDVEFSPQDATRSDPQFILDICKAAVDAGATTINIPDTVGYATPTEFVDMLSQVYAEVKGERDDVIVSTHCHNDLGLAVANSLSALHAGARQIEGAINGIGERAGNTSTEEIIMAVKTREDYYGVEIGADTKEIFETSRLVSSLTGYPIQYNKAVVGRNAFAHESGIHQHGVLRNRETYEIMDPASIGHQSMIVLGKHSGRAAFADALRKMGIQLEDEDFARAFARFKVLADRKGEIHEEGLRAIAEEEAGVGAEQLHLLHIRVSGGDETTPIAVVTVQKGDEELEYSADGDGMVNAAFVALQDAFTLPATLVDYRVSPLTSGADAMAEVNVIIQAGAETYSGRGVSTDVVEGSARAFVAALNKAALDRGALGDPA